MSRSILTVLAPLVAKATCPEALLRRGGALLLLFTLGACGPIASTGPMLRARDLVELARAAGSERFAMYEFAVAREYLAKSREEWSYSDFQKSREYADLAAKCAKQAIALSKREAVPNRDALPVPTREALSTSKRDALTTPVSEPCRALP